MKTLVIIGAGGHGLVVAEAAELMRAWDKILFVDEKYTSSFVINEFDVITQQQFAALACDATDVIVAIGDNATRLSITKNYISQGYNSPIIIHPHASVSRSAKIAAGTVILANAVINAQAVIGLACIINTAAVIEHQCILGDAVHVSPSACLAGNVAIGACSWICAGAIVINNIHIERDVIVGAGSVVITNLTSDQCVVGVPAKQKYLLGENS